MKRLRVLLLSVSGLVTAVPGYKAVQSGLWTPPDYGGLFGGIQIAFSALVLLSIWLLRKNIMRLNLPRLIRISAGFAAIFLVSISLYLVCLGRCVVITKGETPRTGTTNYWPLFPGGDLGKLVRQYSRQEVADRDPVDLQDHLKKQGLRLTGTTIILLLLYLLTISSLVAAFALLGVRVR